MTFVARGAILLCVAGLFGGPALHFADSLFHLLARFEGDHELLWDKDFIAGSRVSSLAGCPSLYLENAEISEFDAMVFDQRLNDGIKGFLDDFLRLELRKANLFGDGFDNLFLGHVGVPYETGQMDEAT
jgi:hypothetical protein